ncbi:MAG: hypothetical protein WEF50_08810 [Myxococcota bacterium]
MGEGIFAGLLGALTIAVYFLLLDVASGRPLSTPNALGAALFIGEVPARGEPVQLMLVAVYTLLHGATFLIVGLAAAREVFTGTRIPGGTPWLRSLVLAGILFVLFEVGSVVFGAFVEPTAQQVIGLWSVSAANLLAALAMATLLRVRGDRFGLHPPGDTSSRRRR